MSVPKRSHYDLGLLSMRHANVVFLPASCNHWLVQQSMGLPQFVKCAFHATVFVIRECKVGVIVMIQ